MCASGRDHREPASLAARLEAVDDAPRDVRRATGAEDLLRRFFDPTGPVDDRQLPIENDVALRPRVAMGGGPLPSQDSTSNTSKAAEPSARSTWG